MKKRRQMPGGGVLGLAVCAGMLLSGCAAQGTHVSGQWVPANAVDAAPRAIETAPVAHYIATPVDGSLRNLLARWAREGNYAMDYRVSTDFTLSNEAAGIRAGSIHAALESLNQSYRAQSVEISLNDGIIVVAPVASVAVAAQTATPARKRKAKR